jgi:hypothetical protein
MPRTTRAYVQMPPEEASVSKSQPMADSRDMIVVHDMFRREFNAIPGLVSGVPERDPAKTAIIADHVTFMVSFLHAPPRRRG